MIRPGDVIAYMTMCMEEADTQLSSLLGGNNVSGRAGTIIFRIKDTS